MLRPNSLNGTRTFHGNQGLIANQTRLAITGGRGTLGRAFGKVCVARGIEHRVLCREEMDIASQRSVLCALKEFRPSAVVNTAGYVRVDDAESDARACFRENAAGVAVLAQACSEMGIGLVTYSSDLVFDGQATAPYDEGAVPHPLSVYGMSKLEAERSALGTMPGALVIRTSSFFGPWDEHNFVTNALRCIRRREPLRVTQDVVVSPTYVPDLVNASLDLLLEGRAGLWHLANRGEVSWFELALMVSNKFGLDDSVITPCVQRDLDLKAPRPPYSPLTSFKTQTMGTLEDALDRYAEELEVY